MSVQEKLEQIFKESFQVKRVAKQIENIREAKQKMGLEIRYTLTKNVQLAVIVEITKKILQEKKSLSFLQKLQFKIVLKSSYPAEPPRVYFLIENSIQIGVNPYCNYLKKVYPEWGPKVTILDIIKVVPAFLVQCNQTSGLIIGQALQYQFFQADRLFTYKGCQTFPVKLFRLNEQFNGMIIIINGQEIVLLEQTSFQNSYTSIDFIKISQLISVQKHKTKHLRALIELKRNGSKFAIEFASDEYDTIIELLVQSMKAGSVFDKEQIEQNQSSESDNEEVRPRSDANNDIVISEKNISEVQSQIIIIQSLVDNRPTSINIKQLVDLLKKAVEYYSVQGDERCQFHLRNLQNIMNNEFMQVLMVSEDEDTGSRQINKKEYQSIVNYI